MHHSAFHLQCYVKPVEHMKRGGAFRAGKVPSFFSFTHQYLHVSEVDIVAIVQLVIEGTLVQLVFLFKRTILSD